VKRSKFIRKTPTQSDSGADRANSAAGEPTDPNAVALRRRASGPVTRSTAPDVELVVKHFERLRRLSEQKRLYLRVGDEVSHLHYEEWGLGVVMEVMTSSVPGGTCLARVRFQDGQTRCFNNDLDNETCCYFFGVRRCWEPTGIKTGVRAAFYHVKGRSTW
jgi:hypothetical protein